MEKSEAYTSLLRGFIDRDLSGARFAISENHEGTEWAVFSKLPEV